MWFIPAEWRGSVPFQNIWVWASVSRLIDCDLLKLRTGRESLCTGSETDSDLRCLALHTGQADWNIRDCLQEKYFLCQSEDDQQVKETELRLSSEQGYVELKSKILSHDDIHVIEITLAFSTHARDALLLWQGTRDNNSGNFLAIAIENGFTTVNVGNTVLRVAERDVSDGEVHDLRLLKSLNNVTLTVDGQYTETSLYSDLDNEFMSRQPVYLGGHHQSGFLYPTGFQGCIHHFGTKNLCREEAASGCTQFGESAVDFRGRQGSGHIVSRLYEAVSLEQCQLAERPERPPTFGLSLDGSSFAQMKSQLFSTQPGQSLHVDFQLTTLDPDGLVLSVGSVRAQDYIVLELVSGRPTARWRLSAGSEQQISCKNSRVSSGQPVNITLGMTNDEIYLRAGREQVFTKLPSSPARLPSAPVYVGGRPHHSAWLSGCLNSMFVTRGPDRRMIHFLRDSQILNATTDDTNCRVQPTPMSPTTTLTTELLTTTTTTPTTTRLTTVSSTTKPTVESRPPSYGLSSNGTGHAELWADEEMFSYDNFNLTMEILITTTQPSGLIFMQGESWDNRLLAIGVHQGKPYTDFNFGTETLKSVQSPVHVDDGQPTLLIVTVSDHVSLQVRDVLSSRPVEGRYPPSSVIYITGLPNGHGHKIGKYSNSFSGCISTFLVTSGRRSEYVDFRQQVTDSEGSGVSVEDEQCRARPQPLTTPAVRADSLGLALSGGGWAQLLTQTRLSLSSGLTVSLLVSRLGDGLLLWLGDFDEYQGGHYISVTLRRAKSALAEWKFGDEVKKIRLSLDLTKDPDTPLYIALRLEGRKVTFTVDSVTRTKAMEGSITPSPPVYLGGAPDVEVITGRKHDTGFVGCIHAVKINDSLLSFNEDFKLINVEDEQSCRVEPFPPQKTPSPITTSTTTVRITSPKPIIEKMKCRDDEKLTLNGRGYFELNHRVITHNPNSEVEIEIHLQTFSADGNILQKKSKRTNDSITIDLVEGFVRFKIFYGRYKKGFEIKSDEKYNDGNVHVIKAKKLENGGGYLQVDDGARKEAFVDLGGRIDHLDTSRAPVYLGGTPDEANEIVACISYLRFWNIPKDANQYGSERLSAFGTISGYEGSTCASSCALASSSDARVETNNSSSIFDKIMDIWS